MKLQKTTNLETATIGTESKKMEFSIDTSNQMIVSILRDKLYSNKIAAVAREVASNSRDANREAGKSDSSVIIEIKTIEDLLGDEQCISFKDSGVGISPDRIENVFLKYGSSTKRDSNSQTGGFGIGAKTPFAYTNEFLISTVSHVNGGKMKHIYQAAILNENGIESSQLILIDSSNTEENTGTEIIVPFKDRRDILEFEKECIRATVLWDIQPTLLGFNSEMPKMKTELEGENWELISGIYDTNLFNASLDDIVLNIDGIPYEFNLNKFRNIDEEIYKKIYNSYFHNSGYGYPKENRNLILKFITGEISMSASREDIEYTQSNLDIIYNKFELMSNDIIENFKNEYNNLETKLDKIDFANLLLSMNNSSSNIRNNVQEFYYKNNIKDCLEENIKRISLFDLFGKSYKTYLINSYDDRLSKTKRNICISDMVTKHLLNNSTIVFMDSGERSNTRVNKTIFSMSTELKKSKILLIQQDTLDIIGLKSDFIQLLDEEGISHYEYKDIEKAPLEKGHRSKTPYVKKEIMNIFARRLDGDYVYKDKLQYRVKEKEITFEETNYNELDENKIVVLPITREGYNIKDLDSGYLGGTLIQEIDNLMLPLEFEVDKNIIESENEEEKKIRLTNERGEKVVDMNFVIKILNTKGYKVFAINSKDMHKIKNSKHIHTTLKDLFKKEILNCKEIKDYAKKVVEENYVNSLNLIQEGDYGYFKKYINNDLAVKVFSSIGFDIKSMKIYKEKEEVLNLENTTKNKNFNSIFRKHSESFNKVINFVSNFKKPNFDEYITEDIINSKLEELKAKKPIIHYIFEKINQMYSYDFDEYSTDNKTGVDIMRDDLLKMLS